MKQPANRIEADMERWLAKEQRFGKLFSTAVVKSKEFQHEKLAYLDKLKTKYNIPLNDEERLSLRVLKRESSRIEKQLYPSLLVRLLRRGWKTARIIVNSIAKNQLQKVNEQYLHNQISSMGLGDMRSSIRAHIVQGKDRFTLPVSWYRKENERLDFEVAFERQTNGSYKIENFKAEFRNEDSGLSREHDFKVGDKELTAAQAANLLAGRAVQVSEKWIQLDLNDKDQNGKYRVKEFYPGYGYDLIKAVSQLPFKELRNENSKQQLLEGLSNGDRQNVTVRTNGKDRHLSIEANPQFKTINVYDQDQKKVTIRAALGKELHQKQQAKQTITLGKRNGLSVG